MAPSGRVAIGIDLGTTNSVVAALVDGRVRVIPDSAGHLLQPSVVSFKPSGERVTGLPARLRRLVDPRNTIHSSKRLIGLPCASAAAQAVIRTLPYRVEPGADDQPLVAVRSGKPSIIDIASFVLAHLKSIAEQGLGVPVEECVLTVPANFSDGQREATRQAGERAGMRVLRILNEPTAAALAYGQSRPTHQRVAVFDMGGGTFDVTLLAIREDLVEVIATGGDPFLGGDDMDRALAEELARRFLEKHRIDLRSNPDAFGCLLIAAEQIKARLSTETATSGALSELAHGEGGRALALEYQVTRDELDQLITPLVERALITCENVLAEAGVSADRVDEVILVGGATRVPLVRRRVAEHFGRPPRVDLDPMEVVAVGAAIQAAILTTGLESASTSPLLLDVASHPLGLAVAGGYTDVVIKKNEPIPCERTRVFTTAHDGQTDVVLRVCQGGERRFDANTLLGELHLRGLRAAPRGDVQIEVTFLVDADGILQVGARDLATGRAEHATLRVPGVGSRG